MLRSFGSGFIKIPSIKNLTINDFRLFEGSQEFVFSKLNIITGANNSGKSSLIKFISLISSGFRNSDFPAIKLSFSKNQLFLFNDLKNWKTDSEFISFSFEYESKFHPKPVKVSYKFIDGLKQKMPGYMIFHTLELVVDRKIVFGIYKDFTGKDHKKYFQSPLEGDNPSELKFQMNLSFFKSVSKKHFKFNFNELFEHLHSTFGKSWWGEMFNEEEFYDTERIYDQKIEDFYAELYYDRNCNLVDYNKREELLFNSKDSVWIEYKSFAEKLGYSNFINDVLIPFFKELKSHTILFSLTTHIKSEDILSKAFIGLDESTGYLNKVENILNVSDDKFEFESFAHELLMIFDFDGFIGIKNHFGSGFTVDFIPAITNKNPGLKVQKDTKNAINISKMGSGTGAVFVLILKTLAAVYELERTGKSEKDKIEPSYSTPSPVILLEEAESLLHPKWQSRLADFITLAAERYAVQFIIETHSEYFLRKLQYLTATDRLKPEDTKIYYLHHPNNIPNGEKQIKSITIEKDGSLTNNFGSGFFDEADNIALELYRIRRNKAINN